MYSVKLCSNDDNVMIIQKIMRQRKEWSDHITEGASAVAAVKSYLKKYGVRIVSNQQYKKSFRITGMQFKTEAEYTMFKLKWM